MEEELTHPLLFFIKNIFKKEKIIMSKTMSKTIAKTKVLYGMFLSVGNGYRAW